MNQTRTLVRLALASLLAAAGLSQAQTSSFTYQGELLESGLAVDGEADLQFGLFDQPTGGAQVGPLLSASSVAVANGRFTALLDFGSSAFGSAPRYLEIHVRYPAGTGAFVPLAGRQLISASPVATFALNVAPTATPWNFSGSGAILGTSGNVGLGTGTPGAKLHVAGADAATGLSLNVADRLYVKPGSLPSSSFVGVNRSVPVTSAEYFGVEAPITGTSFGGMYIRTPSATGRPFYGYSNTGGGIAYHYLNGTDNTWRLFNNGERLAVSSTGHVGIGTTSPAAPLDLALGDKRMQFRFDGGLVPSINLTGTGSNVGTMRLRNRIELFPSDDGLVAASMDVRNAAGSPTISLTGSAGDMAMAGTLTIDTTSSNTGLLTSASMRFGTGSGEGMGSTRTSGGSNRFGLDLFTNYTPRLSITNDGDVGIGTRIPQHTLDVAGTVRATDGIVFPDGSTQTRAWNGSGPLVRVNQPSAQFTVSYMGSDCSFASPVEIGFEVVEQTLGSDPAPRKSLGNCQGMRWTLTRRSIIDATWANAWNTARTAASPTGSTVTALLTTTTGTVQWTITNTIITGYRLGTNVHGQPAEYLEVECNLGEGGTIARTSTGTPALMVPTQASQFRFQRSTPMLTNTWVVPAASQYRNTYSSTFNGRFPDLAYGPTYRNNIKVRASSDNAATLFEQFRTFCILGQAADSDERAMTVTYGSNTLISSSKSGFCGYTLRVSDDGLPVEEFEFYIE
jgi:hypothetical protein